MLINLRFTLRFTLVMLPRKKIILKENQILSGLSFLFMPNKLGSFGKKKTSLLSYNFR